MATASVHLEELRKQTLRGLKARAAQHAAVARLSHAALGGAGIDELVRDGVQAIAGWLPGADVAVVPASAEPFDDACTTVIPLDSGHGDTDRLLAVRASRPLRDDERAFAESVATVLLAAMARARADELEAQARRNESLAAAGQLAAGVAHDVNNLVTVIKLYAELLESESALDDRARERLRAIRTQAERAVSLAWQVLDTAHRQPLQLADVDLVAFLDEFAGVIGRLLPAEVTLAVEHEQPAQVVRADPARLQQVMTNLVANAGQALAGGGSLTISVAAAGDGLPGAWTRIDVADTGVGIAADALPRVFEPFFSTKAPGQGSGLGLTQVQALVVQHGGHVTVRSAPGEGTVVSVWLPAAGGRGRVAVDASSGPAAPAGAGQVILVVEDDPALRGAVVDALVTLGYRPEAVGDGEDALAWLSHAGAGADAVLSDIAMAGLGGEGLARRMAVAWPDIPVILTTSAPGETPGPGPVLRLAKPFSVEQLATIVAAALE